MSGKKSYEDDDSRWLPRTNVHEKRNSNKADRKHTKRQLSDFSCLSDCFEDEDEDDVYADDFCYEPDDLTDDDDF